MGLSMASLLISVTVRDSRKSVVIYAMDSSATACFFNKGITALSKNLTVSLNLFNSSQLYPSLIFGMVFGGGEGVRVGEGVGVRVGEGVGAGEGVGDGEGDGEGVELIFSH